MADKTTSAAMKEVLGSMGRAAREGRARRFVKRPGNGAELSFGELELTPDSGPKADVEVDPVKQDMSDEEMTELMAGMEIQGR